MAQGSFTSPRLASKETGAALQLSGFGRPFGVAADASCRVYVADMDLHAIARLSPDFLEVSWLAGDGTGWTRAERVGAGTAERTQSRKPQGLNGPHSVALEGNGSFWVCTYYTPGLHHFDADGRHLKTHAAVGPKVLAGPATARLDSASRLLITEYGLHCVLVADTDGNARGVLGGGQRDGLAAPSSRFAAGNATGAFDRPHMTTELADGSFVVADTWNHRLQHFDADFTWCGWLGGGRDRWRRDEKASPPGSGPGFLNAPVAVSAMADGRFVVTDWGNNWLAWYDIDGSLIEIEAGLGLEKPYDAQLLGGLLVVADAHNGRVLFKKVS